jgi:hypothetical protein
MTLIFGTSYSHALTRGFTHRPPKEVSTIAKAFPEMLSYNPHKFSGVGPGGQRVEPPSRKKIELTL